MKISATVLLTLALGFFSLASLAATPAASVDPAIAAASAEYRERTWQKSFVTLSDSIPRYVEYLPAAPGQKTLVFTNGLVYDLRRWRDMTRVLEAQGYG